MKTQISEFCIEFGEALFPLAEALTDAVNEMEKLEASQAVNLHTALANLHHRLEALVNKVQGQEAYVLLFGPLKSGKSTLMNAISASYVSEVTSMPAYPCMVNLRYGPKPSWSAIRYSGKREEMNSPEALKDLLTQSHRTLSERVRAIEDFGENFEPEKHLPSAIRRVQVELPAENLRDSGTVLVDTPGLYSKMKFGYDAMSREFRDSAASAVFVVKTDNLFLEQVFDDFNDLLDQFSRVFVVVNIDSGKRDLSPDGSLEQSLESRDPSAIVSAFESLTMSAPLRRAAESGRLHIYPVDLCSAASRRLSPGASLEPDPESGDDFDIFLRDLLSYLNSTDYLVEFMADTIRQSRKISEGILEQCESGPAQAIERNQKLLQEERQELSRAHDAATRLLNYPWYEKLQKHFETQHAVGEAENAEELTRFQEEARESLETWFTTDDSIKNLCEDRLGTLMRTLCENHSRRLRATINALPKTPRLGMAFSGEENEDLKCVDLNLEDLADKSLPDLLPKESLPPGEPSFPAEAIPLRRSIADKLLFRSVAKRRNKLFGEPESRKEALTPKNKEKYLARNAIEEMLETANQILSTTLKGLDRDEGADLLDALGTQLSQVIHTDLQERQSQFSRQKEQNMLKSKDLEKLSRTFDSLSGTAESVRDTVRELGKKHQTVFENKGDATELSGDAVDASLADRKPDPS